MLHNAYIFAYIKKIKCRDIQINKNISLKSVAYSIHWSSSMNLAFYGNVMNFKNKLIKLRQSISNCTMKTMLF